MIPRESAKGSSFVGCSRYYLHDSGAETNERIGFTEVLNMRGVKDPEKAFRFMAYTTMAANETKERTGARGRRIERPVWSQSFAWNPEQEPTREEMIGAARSWMDAFGLSDHQAVIVQHTDRPHPHIHLILNLYNPLSKKVVDLGLSKLKTSRWAEQYERDNGGKIYCKKREENNARRAEGEFVKYQEPAFDLKAKVTELYHASDTGAAFRSALEASGLKIADGGKRLVIIDRNCEVHNLSRQIDGAKSKQIKAKLAGLQLPTLEEAQARYRPELLEPQVEKAREMEEQGKQEVRTGQQEEEYIDRDAYEERWNESVVEAAIQAESTKATSEGGQAVDVAPIPGVDGQSAARVRAEEISRFQAESNERRRVLAAQMETEHGERQRSLQRASSRLDQLLRNSGPVRRFWLRVTRQIPKNAREQLGAMRAEIGQIEALRTTARNSLEDQINREKTAIENRHQMACPELAPNQTRLVTEWKRNYDQAEEQPDLEEDMGPSLRW